MKIGHDYNLCRSHIYIVLNYVDKFVEGYGVDWAVSHDPFILFQLKDSFIEVKDFGSLEIVAVWPFDQVIPNLDHVVAEVQMTINKIV